MPNVEEAEAKGAKGSRRKNKQVTKHVAFKEEQKKPIAKIEKIVSKRRQSHDHESMDDDDDDSHSQNSSNSDYDISLSKKGDEQKDPTKSTNISILIIFLEK
jgi:hypothetical protein